MSIEAAEIIEDLRQRDLNVTLTDDDNLELYPAEKVTRELIERLRKHKSAIIEELKRELRREKVLMMLEEQPKIQRAFVTDTEGDQHNVILTLAIRNTGICELRIPKHRYDPFILLEIIQKCGIQ